MKTSLTGLAVALFSLVVAFGVVGAAHAHQDGEESVQPLMKQPLPDVPGKNALMATVTLAPGQSAAPHLHPGSIFAYVLEGEVISQLEGQDAKIYTAGQSWYEPPRTHHLVTRNASNIKPAKLLVWAIVGAQDPIKLPLPGTSSLNPTLPALVAQ